MKNQAANNGTFIPKPGFTVVQNSVARDWNLSSGALGLYTRIQSYITMENITLTKGSLMERVPEGEYAFNTAWNELKSKGYLFIHVYPGEKGRFVYQYELRPDNSGWDGAYLFYHDRNGDVKSTNLTRNQTETAEQPAEKAAADHHPNYHPGGNYHSGNHCGGNRGGNIKLNHKEKLIKTNLSISPAAEPPEDGGEMDENALENIVLPALTKHKSIPQAYMAKPALIQTAIHYLTGYDFRQQHPYQATASRMTPAKAHLGCSTPALPRCAVPPAHSRIAVRLSLLTRCWLKSAAPATAARRTAWSRMWRMCWIPFCRQSPRGRSKTCRST